MITTSIQSYFEYQYPVEIGDSLCPISVDPCLNSYSQIVGVHMTQASVLTNILDRSTGTIDLPCLPYSNLLIVNQYNGW